MQCTKDSSREFAKHAHVQRKRGSMMEVDKATDLIFVSLRLRLGAATAERVSDRCSAVAPPCRCLFNSPLWLQPCPSLCFMETR